MDRDMLRKMAKCSFFQEQRRYYMIRSIQMYRALGAVMLKVRECSGGVFVSRRLARPGQSMVGWTSKLRVGRLFDILFIK